MLARALIFLITTLADFLTIALLLRFVLQWARAAQRNQITDFLNALTNWAVRPARRIIPGWGGLDLATLFLAWLVEFITIFLVFELSGVDVVDRGAVAIAGMALFALVALLRMTLYILIVALIIQAVLSWVNPYSPIAPMI